MRKFNVVVKNWRTGEVVSTYTNIDKVALAAIEVDWYANAPASWDLDITEI